MKLLFRDVAGFLVFWQALLRIPKWTWDVLVLIEVLCGLIFFFWFWCCLYTCNYQATVAKCRQRIPHSSSQHFCSKTSLSEEDFWKIWSLWQLLRHRKVKRLSYLIFWATTLDNCWKFQNINVKVLNDLNIVHVLVIWV